MNAGPSAQYTRTSANLPSPQALAQGPTAYAVGGAGFARASHDLSPAPPKRVPAPAPAGRGGSYSTSCTVLTTLTAINESVGLAPDGPLTRPRWCPGGHR